MIKKGEGMSMKKYHIIVGMVLFSITMGLYCAEPKIITQSELPMKKKKILILTSFTGGNKLAAEAMQEYLEPDYEVQLCKPFIEILYPIDPIHSMTLGTYSGEQLYNKFVTGGHFDFLGWIYGMGKDYIQSEKKATTHDLLHNYFKEHNPDLIISVIPVINNIVLDVAREMEKPFILAPTDLDVSPYITDITNPNYEKFYLCSIFDDPDIMEPIQKANIPIHIVGAPLKSAFFTPTPKDKIYPKDPNLKLYNYDSKKPTIMVLMGSGGLDDIKKYAIQLLLLKNPCNLIMCVGNNKDSEIELNKLKPMAPPHITMDVIGWTKYIADYMALSDLFITKSGTMSVCEALYRNLPLLLDKTSEVLLWEQFNHHFVKKHGFGQSIPQYDAVVPLVDTLLGQPRLLGIYRKNIEQFEKKTFPKEFRELVDKILKQ